MRFPTLATAFALLVATAPVAASAADEPASIETRLEAARGLMMSDPASAQRIAGEAETQLDARSRSPGDVTAMATAQWLQAEAALRLGNYTGATPLIDKAFRNAGGQRTQLGGEIHLTRGALRNMQGQIAGALSDFQTAFRIFAAVGNPRSEAIALTLISSLYSDAKDYDRALRYLTQASDIYRGDPGMMVALYNNRGGVLQDLRRHDEAERQFAIALAQAERMRSPVLVAQVLRNMARNRLKAGRVADAEQAVRRSLAVAADGEASSWRPQLLALAAEAAFQRGNMAQAAELIDQSFAGIDLDTTEPIWLEPHLTAYRVYQRTGDYRRALIHLGAAKRIDDETTTLATNTGNALMAARFDFANQELRITKLRAEELRRTVALEQASARFQQMIFTAITAATAVLVAVLGIALFTIRRSRNALEVARDGLAETNVALNRALTTKTEFLATTSHEIRTPLNGILGMTQVMLADAAIDTTTRERLGVVKGAGLTMQALVDDILDVAKMETGNLTLEERPFDLAETIGDAARLWEDQARAKGLAVVVDLAGAPGRIVGDAARIRQIVFNLLANAVKFTATGRITLTVTTDAAPDAASDAGAGVMRIAVADTGIGIPVDKQAAIFESFRQADASTTRRFGGTGLGLAICRNLAVAMGGDIGVTSVVGEGACFTVTLPLRLAEPADAADTTSTSPAGTRAAMLVIERNPIRRATWRTLLEPRAGRIVFTDTVAEGLATLNMQTVSAMLIDDAAVALGDDGLDDVVVLAERARQAGCPVTLLWTPGRDGRDRLAAAVTRVVDKPVSGKALLATLFAPDCGESFTSHLVPRPS